MTEALDTTSETGAAAAPPPPKPAAPLPIAPALAKRKGKVPVRRVYGDDIEQTFVAGRTPDGEDVTDVCYPHYGEWVEFSGSMTLDAYMDALEANQLRGKERELRSAMARLEERTAASGDGPVSPEDQALIDELQAELARIGAQIRTSMKATMSQLASRVVRLAWTDTLGRPVGTPTGEHDEQGNAICTVTPDDIGQMEMSDIGWMTEQSFGEMRGDERGKG